MKKPSIVVVGSSNTDMIVRAKRLPGPGETVLGGEFALAGGGKGANQAVSAARAGGTVTFVANVGADAFGDQALAGFHADQIDTRFVFRDPSAPSGVALILVNPAGENSIAVASGANARLRPGHVRRARAAFQQADLVLLQLETPLDTVRAAVQLAAETGARVILNPAPAQALPRALLRRIFLLTPNAGEAGLLTGVAARSRAGAVQAAKKLLATGVQNVIITLGSRGALLASRECLCVMPPFDVKPVDTTAAGDVFNGALAVSLAEGRSLPEAARFAAAAAAISVTRRGAQPSIPSRLEIEKLLGTKTRKIIKL